MTTYPLSLPQNNPLITLTQPEPRVWIIELHNGQDSRLTATVINEGLLPALDIVEKEWRASQKRWDGDPKNQEGSGALIIVGRKDQDKFFSNGLDTSILAEDPSVKFIPNVYNPFLARLLSFPIPTVAAINGHCFAGAMMLSLACDFRVMTDGSQRHAWMCMNEVHWGAILPFSFTTVLKNKFGSAPLVRKIALEGHRFTPSEALEAGLVDYIVKGKTAEVLDKAMEVARKMSANARAGVWGDIKENIYRSTLKDIWDKDYLKAKL